MGWERGAGQSGLQCQHFAVVWIAWSLWLETLPDYPHRRACSLWDVGQHVA